MRGTNRGLEIAFDIIDKARWGNIVFEALG